MYGKLLVYKEKHGNCDVLSKIGFSWDPRNDDWEQMYRQLCEFHKKHGHCNVPQTINAQYNALNTWVGWQRRAFRKGQLSKDQLDCLTKLCFSWDPFTEAWEEMYQQLCEYHRKHGHCNVPPKTEESRYKALGSWVSAQRERFKQGRLPKNQERRLNELGFSWIPMNEAWEEMFQQLCQFHRKHGHANVPDNTKGEYQGLSGWIRTQRERYKKGSLPKDQQSRLNELAFSWDPINEAWEQMFQQLCEFHRKHSHCDLPANKSDSLANWVQMQRQLRKKAKLTELQIKRLTDLGFPGTNGPFDLGIWIWSRRQRGAGGANPLAVQFQTAFLSVSFWFFWWLVLLVFNDDWSSASRLIHNRPGPGVVAFVEAPQATRRWHGFDQCPMRSCENDPGAKILKWELI